VINTTQWKIHEGHLPDFLAAAEEYKKQHERLGAQVRMWVPLAGGQANTVLYVIEHADIAAYGAFMKKLTTDADYQKLVKGTQQQLLVNPIAEMTASTLLSEPWLPS
jgi:putative AlgH/UPF0301 family transcriptional regulator